MPVELVEEGGFYVGGSKGRPQTMREVVRLADDGRVTFKRYLLDSGENTGASKCSLAAFCTWADRKATVEEVTGLQRDITQAGRPEPQDTTHLKKSSRITRVGNMRVIEHFRPDPEKMEEAVRYLLNFPTKQ